MSTIVAKYDGRAHEIRTRVVVMPAIGGLASVPAAVKCVAVWDTGSNNSVIDAGVARKLGLTPISMTTVLTANGPLISGGVAVPPRTAVPPHTARLC